MVCREDQAQNISGFFGVFFLLRSFASGTRLGAASRELEALLELVGVRWCHPTLRGHTGSFRDPWQNDDSTKS